MKISPALIPHHLFHTGIWLQPVQEPSWYYYSPKQSQNVITNKQFYESLDPQLKEVVTFLHKKGIRTTASCTGHNKSISDFENIYASLLHHRSLINKDGMVFRDVESGEDYFYRDEEYTLPWTRELFLHEIMAYQRKGVLGIRVDGRKKLKEQLQQIYIDGVEVQVKDNILLLLTPDLQNEEQIKNTWKEISFQVKDIVERLI